jgi:ATP-dependent exoDNAse (exonuclease V) alpha subunit
VIPEVSDGSQFELSRELVYTAVTRARHHVTLYATPEEFVAAASTPTVRYSGLTRRLKWWQNQPV